MQKLGRRLADPVSHDEAGWELIQTLFSLILMSGYGIKLNLMH